MQMILTCNILQVRGLCLLCLNESTRENLLCYSIVLEIANYIPFVWFLKIIDSEHDV